MGLNSRRRTRLAVFIALGLLGIVAAVVYLRYSTLLEIAPPRFVIRPPQAPQPPQWSAAWKHDRRRQPVLAKSAPSEDQIEVYRAFLNSYGTGGKGRLNVGNRTTTLEISEDDIRGCPYGSRTRVVLGFLRDSPAIARDVQEGEGTACRCRTATIAGYQDRPEPHDSGRGVG